MHFLSVTWEIATNVISEYNRAIRRYSTHISTRIDFIFYFIILQDQDKEYINTFINKMMNEIIRIVLQIIITSVIIIEVAVLTLLYGSKIWTLRFTKDPNN